MKQPNFEHVTEISGDNASREQIQRMYNRYNFACHYCQDKDVLEVACGSGQGLGYLAKKARSIVGGDYSEPILQLGKRYYQNRIPLVRFDAQYLPFKDKAFDVVIFFEAIYYLKNPLFFALECARILKPKGTLIVCNANKDLPDFNPSPYSYMYLSPSEFYELLTPLGFRVETFGHCYVDYDSPRQRFLTFLKRTAVRWKLIPKTMAGKKFLKRLIFGKLAPIPLELTDKDASIHFPTPIETNKPDYCHKVIFAIGHLDR